MNFHPSSRSSRSSPCFDGIASSRTASACMRYYPTHRDESQMRRLQRS